MFLKSPDQGVWDLKVSGARFRINIGCGTAFDPSEDIELNAPDGNLFSDPVLFDPGRRPLKIEVPSKPDRVYRLPDHPLNIGHARQIDK